MSMNMSEKKNSVEPVTENVQLQSILDSLTDREHPGCGFYEQEPNNWTWWGLETLGVYLCHIPQTGVWQTTHRGEVIGSYPDFKSGVLAVSELLDQLNVVM